MRTIRFRQWFRSWIHELLRQGRFVEAARLIFDELIYADGASRQRGKNASSAADDGALDIPHAERCNTPHFQQLISPKQFNQKEEDDHDRQQFRL